MRGVRRVSDMNATKQPARIAYLAKLIATAITDNAENPAYNGLFDGYILCMIKRDISTKLGTAFTKDEVAICSNAIDTSGRNPCRTVYSATNKMLTSVTASNVVMLPC